MDYKLVIGLEIHIQLSTKSKAFCGDKSSFGDAPNTNVSEVSLGMPGALPKINQKVIDHAIKLGLACGSKISEYNEFSRKNYFYVDLPKGYQITQYHTPICSGGSLRIDTEDNDAKDFPLTRIHIEEDTGKSIHDLDPFDTLIDLNRAGVPLLEMVTEPHLRTPEDAYHFLHELRKVVRHLDISTGNMEEGSMRCDVNISLRQNDSDPFGTKVEVKNINSISNVQRAIRYETARQSKLIDTGQTVVQETRTWDPQKGQTVGMRKKEDGEDYCYFPEPDLPPFTITPDYIQAIRSTMPPLPRDRYQRYMSEFNLSPYDALKLSEDKDIANYFESVVSFCPNTKSAANWIMGPVKSHLNEHAIGISDFKVASEQMAEIISIIDQNIISFTTASQKLFPELVQNPKANIPNLIAFLGIKQNSDEDALRGIAKSILERYPEKVSLYASGKKGLLGLFMGELMKASKGKADPKLASRILKELLDQ